MKTKNNVQKTILKSLAVVTSLVLLSVVVNAQAFWKTVLENNSLNHIAIAMTEMKAETSAADVKATSSLNAAMFAEFGEKEIESPMELEEWMTNENVFNSNLWVLETETEASLELENWMLDDNFGREVKTSSKVLFENYEVEKDNELKLEPWMLETSNRK